MNDAGPVYPAVGVNVTDPSEFRTTVPPEAPPTEFTFNAPPSGSVSLPTNSAFVNVRGVPGVTVNGPSLTAVGAELVGAATVKLTVAALELIAPEESLTL